jgi:hypothetical protein
MRVLMVVPAVTLALSASDLEQEMQSLLQRRCLSCHGPKPKPQGSTFPLPTALKGGVSGPALKPGSPAQSLLLGAIARVAS